MIRRYQVLKRFTGGLLNGLTYLDEFHHDDKSSVPMWTVGQDVKSVFGTSPFKVESVTEVPMVNKENTRTRVR